MKRRILWGVLVVSLLGLPASWVSALVLVNIANPMALAFLTSFTVRNESGEPAHITPIAPPVRTGKRWTLPLSVSPRYYLRPPTCADFQLQPGEQRRFTYDSDDISFSEIAVRDLRGNWYQLVVDAEPTKRRYREPSTDFFVIPSWWTLPAESDAVRTAATRPDPRFSRLWLIVALGFIPPVTIAICLKSLYFNRGTSTRANRLNCRSHRPDARVLSCCA